MSKNTNHQTGLSSIGDMFRLESALLMRNIIMAMIVDAIKREDWDMISLIIDSWEQVKLEPYVKAANDYLKKNPMEIIIP